MYTTVQSADREGRGIPVHYNQLIGKSEGKEGVYEEKTAAEAVVPVVYHPAFLENLDQIELTSLFP